VSAGVEDNHGIVLLVVFEQGHDALAGCIGIARLGPCYGEFPEQQFVVGGQLVGPRSFVERPDSVLLLPRDSSDQGVSERMLGDCSHVLG